MPPPTAARATVAPKPSSLGTTPQRFRFWSVITLAAIAVFGLVLFVAATSLVDSSRRIEENSAPVLVSTQDLLASVAEAETTSSAVFLGGENGDREQRRLYLTARDRSARQVEEISRRIGDDDAAHESLQLVSEELSANAGLVEEARSRNLLGDPNASQPLEASIDAVGQRIVPEINQLAASAQENFDDDVDASALAFWAAMFVGLIIVVLLLLGLSMLRKATNRLLNLPLLFSLVLVLVALIWAFTGYTSQQSTLDQAKDDALASITTTAEIQRNAFSYKTAETVALIDGAESGRAALDDFNRALAAQDFDQSDIDSAAIGVASEAGLLFDAVALADNNRETAAVAEMLTRWNRYRAQSTQVESLLSAGDVDGAREVAIGPGNSAFLGFNASVESVLFDNRAQFLAAAADARSASSGMRLMAILLPLFAALASLWGYQQRISEYR